ncbi:hypothetical protein EG832_03590 [bacterium]|nr:hypothetical protein [bacterium]
MSPDPIQITIDFFEKYSGTIITQEDAREINDRVMCFLNILNQWRSNGNEAILSAMESATEMEGC